MRPSGCSGALRGLAYAQMPSALQVDRVSYLLQEIYGIENKNNQETKVCARGACAGFHAASLPSFSSICAEADSRERPAWGPQPWPWPRRCLPCLLWGPWNPGLPSFYLNFLKELTAPIGHFAPFPANSLACYHCRAGQVSQGSLGRGPLLPDCPSSFHKQGFAAHCWPSALSSQPLWLWDGGVVPSCVWDRTWGLTQLDLAQPGKGSRESTGALVTVLKAH